METVQIEGFRCFESFRLDELSRVNLVLGTNNSGKTSLLEALEILNGGGRPGPVMKSCHRRGEIVFDEREDRRPPLDVRHLFQGRDPLSRNTFEIKSGAEEERFVRVVANPGPVQEELLPDSGSSPLPAEVALFLEGSALADPLHVTSRQMSERRLYDDVSQHGEPESATQFVTTYDYSLHELPSLWSGIALEDEEEQVIEALKVIEPDIGRIAYLPGFSRRSSEFTGFFVKMKSQSGRIPIGSLGDGLKRLLTLALHLVSAQDGLLLVDEIDTGLHHSVMLDMWKLLAKTAERLDTQVFATTHSLDCVRSLAWLCEEEPELKDDVSVHRLEEGAESAVSYSADEIIEAVEHDIEVR